MEESKDEFKRPLAKPSLKLQLVPSADAEQSAAAAADRQEIPQEALRASLSRSDVSLSRVSGKKGSTGSVIGSPRNRPIARTVSSVYSPRWILNVKRESDKQVRAFVDSLPSSGLEAGLMHELEEESNKFLRFKTDNLGTNTTAMLSRLQKLLVRCSSSKEKQMVVRLLLIISSCSRLDMYISSVREAEDATIPAQISARSGYDGQMEYRKLDSPRLRDSATKRASFLSVSLGPEEMEAYMDMASSGPSSPNSREGDDVICRICEHRIPKSIYLSHAKFCGQKGLFCFNVVSHSFSLSFLFYQLDTISRFLVWIKKSQSKLD